MAWQRRGTELQSALLCSDKPTDNTAKDNHHLIHVLPTTAYMPVVNSFTFGDNTFILRDYKRVYDHMDYNTT